MKLQKILRTELGFSMVEITVALGLLGIASLAVMNLSDNINTSTRRAEAMLSKSQFASALGSYVYSAFACNEFKNLPSPLNATARPIVLKDWKIAGLNGDVLADVSAGKQFKNFRLSRLDASIDITNPNLQVVRLGGVDHVKTLVQVVSQVELRQSAKNDNKLTYDYFYSVPVLANRSTGAVVSCGDEKDLQETCISMQGVYNPTTKQCDLKKGCELKGAFTRLTCAPAGQTCNTSGGSTTNNSLTGSPSCPSGSVQIQTGYKEWSHVGTCSGKKCTPPNVLNMLNYYSCLECP